MLGQQTIDLSQVAISKGTANAILADQSASAIPDSSYAGVQLDALAPVALDLSPPLTSYTGFGFDEWQPIDLLSGGTPAYDTSAATMPATTTPATSDYSSVQAQFSSPGNIPTVIGTTSSNNPALNPSLPTSGTPAPAATEYLPWFLFGGAALVVVMLASRRK